MILGKVADISANPWDEFTFAVELDVAGKYWMFWTPDDETQIITYEVNKDFFDFEKLNDRGFVMKRKKLQQVFYYRCM